MATFKLFEEFGSELGKGTHNFSSHTLRVALTNSAPNVDTHDELADITQISATGGYTPAALGSLTWAETGAGTGIWQLTSADVTFTATGADFDAFRYVVLYNDTATGDKLIGYLDYGSGVNLTNGNTFTIDVGANGWFQLTIPA